MLKSLDKYMDNLKSPYWEFYFLAGAMIFGISGGFVIFIDPNGLAEKFTNIASFLGGLFTVVGVIIAFIAYRKSRIEHKENLLFEAQTEIEVNLLLGLDQEIIIFINKINKIIAQINDNKSVGKLQLERNISELDVFRLKFERMTLYLNRLGALNQKYENGYDSFMHTLCDIKLANTYLIKIIQSTDDNKQIYKDQLEKLLDSCVFCKKYLVKLGANNQLSIKDNFTIYIDIGIMKTNLEKFYSLKPN